MNVMSPALFLTYIEQYYYAKIVKENGFTKYTQIYLITDIINNVNFFESDNEYVIFANKQCPNRNVPRYYCDRCGEEVDAYFDIDGDMVCDDCAHDILIEMYDYHTLY